MNSIWDFIGRFYSPQDYAALDAQRQRWKSSRPLAGAKILDGTPIFRNTLVKYAVLLDAGADLTISAGKNIPCDPEIVKLAPEFGIRVADETALKEKFDAVADCAGRHISVDSRCGYAELTRSGLEYYKNSPAPVYSVDSGILKRFETTLGTGESFVRAMKYLGHNDFSGKKIIVFGGGKVGRGSAYFSALAGARVFIADINTVTPPPGVEFVAARDTQKVEEIINTSWCAVSATGLAGALAEYVPALKAADILIANMGVEDEFGEELESSRVLNNKLPLNFILEEPTEIRYIDPSMALSNAALLKLLEGKAAAGINLPEKEFEMEIIADMRNAGVMNSEIDLILKESL
ncbi:MAG: hypothetical protein E7051_03415 [Lentisphaerae bacterium]|nr:hypothetical protein [Lentisphaerota bacterium]MBR2719882.1 hypothetical protein [Lentisphaeria bacterium]